MNLNSRRKLFVTGGLTVGALLGGYGFASAQSSSTSPTAPAASQGESNSPSIQSSVTVPNGPDQVGGENDAAESAALAKLATITPAQAKDAALKAHPGTVDKVELENENGSVVYSVSVRTATGQLDVKVDAGNGTVLAAESDDDGGAEGKGAKDAETNDAPDAHFVERLTFGV